LVIGHLRTQDLLNQTGASLCDLHGRKCLAAVAVKRAVSATRKKFHAVMQVRSFPNGQTVTHFARLFQKTPPLSEST